jgi:hydantoinase/carbamoylase family amidase
MIDGERLGRDLEELSRIGRLPGGGLSRPAFSPADREARDWFSRRLEKAGLAVKVDEAGNISGRLPGRGPALLCGSHLDTVEDGVLAALECARVIKERDLCCPPPLEVIAFSDEEEAFFGFFGSLALTGRVSQQDLEEARNRAGEPLTRALARSGLNPRAVPRARRDPASIKAFVELHVEQGPLLADQGVPAGVVEAIMGNSRFGITIRGRRDHAGIPMKGRLDPLLGAVSLIESMRGHCRKIDPETLFTIGRFTAEPGLENVIPATVSFSMDLRHPELAILTKLGQRLEMEIKRLGPALGLEIEQHPLLKIPPAAMSPAIREVIRESAGRLGIGCLPLRSGAGHDAQVLSRLVPAGMIFVPSVGGRSHCSEEHTDRHDIEAGAELLLAVLLRLAVMDIPRPGSAAKPVHQLPDQ